MRSMIRYPDQNVTEIGTDAVPGTAPIIPLRNAVVLPGVLLPIFVGRNESVSLIEKHGQPGTMVALFTQRRPSDETVDQAGLYQYGALAEIHRIIPMGEGGYQVLLQAVQKIQLLELTATEPYLEGRIEPLGEIQDCDEQVFLEFQQRVAHYIKAHPGIPDEIAGFVQRIRNPSALANQIVFFSQREISEKIEFLRMSSAAEKIEKLQQQIIEETNQMSMEREVREKVEEDTQKIQRDFYLRKQLEQIRKELGETDDDETDELEKQLAEKTLPTAVRKAVNKELSRLRRLQDGPQGGGMEAGQIRNWLELIAELPWHASAEELAEQAGSNASAEQARSAAPVDQDPEHANEDRVDDGGMADDGGFADQAGPAVANAEGQSSDAGDSTEAAAKSAAEAGPQRDAANDARASDQDSEARDGISLTRAAEVLDEDHEGLEEVKKRILEYLAVEKQTGGSKAPILCLVGPPGVGKTSLARSVARAIERPLVRSALGGVRDEAEIRGHRRTYVGALPGKILTAMRKAERTDPVFLLDEVDKTGQSYHGDPSAALLEVLDPEQNHEFEDHYLGLPYDLSRVLFICTANNADAIPAPLLDRMEVVHLSGYTMQEKMAIAKNHLAPKILKDLKLQPETIQFTDAAIEKVITAHTREAGVRNLKRKLESLARKAIRELIESRERRSEEGVSGGEASNGATGGSPDATNGTAMERVRFDAEDVEKRLGRDRYFRDLKEDTQHPGVAVGLAWTPVGGDILYIETAAYPGKGELKLSGQLGDVMKESAVAALSFLRSHASELGIADQDFAKKDVHIHIPSGAIPKDGPSAGVTLLTALGSLFTGIPVASDLAMTGEISLRGRILPVGGIKEKVLAARMAGIDRVLLPEKNRAEFEEIPDHVKEGLEVEYFGDMLALLKTTLPGAFWHSMQSETTAERKHAPADSTESTGDESTTSHLERLRRDW